MSSLDSVGQEDVPLWFGHCLPTFCGTSQQLVPPRARDTYVSTWSGLAGGCRGDHGSTLAGSRAELKSFGQGGMRWACGECGEEMVWNGGGWLKS